MSSDYEWRRSAKCAGMSTETFYPPRKKALYKDIADVAKAVCRGLDGQPPCPVRVECLTDAISRDEPHGIWGGMSHRERNALVRKFGRQQRAVAYMNIKDFIEKGPPV